jgi:hypothetical protein
MSDIYLQITETPTVVTLSAPVVSGALASTVTVANTVTVALDANSLSALENVTVTVGAAITGTVTVSNFPASQAVTFSAVTISNLPSTQTIAGTVTANLGTFQVKNYNNVITSGYFKLADDSSLVISGMGDDNAVLSQISSPLPTGTNQIGSVTASISGTVPVSGTFWQATQPVSGTFFQATQPVSLTSTTVTVSSLPALVAGTANIGVVTIGNIRRSTDGATTQLTTEVGSGYLEVRSYIGAGTAQIGSVTVSNSVTIGSLPALVAGTAQIGSVTVSNSVVTFYPLQGTTVTNTNFTSVTASTTLVSAVAGREVLTVFNEGAGNLHISPGASCTSVAYQVRLSAGDYWECPAGQLSLAHTAVFATAGTARVCQVT